MTQISDVYQFSLLPTTDEQAFLTFARQEGFALASVTRAGTVTSQYLLREHVGAGGRPRYLWVVHWTLHFGIEALDQIGDSLWKVHQQTETQAELVSYARYIEIAEYLNPVGESNQE
ncbi:MAG: hypothetical protein A2W35_21880 [Chloroflexi bacterium RBG_16_57_11]|nr:MAG: hypothetical protein A2W35_21880 [Chloroflexi bacterium RBG_16_57_11]